MVGKRAPSAMGESAIVGSPYLASTRSREVLHGVGADGVGVKLPIFAVNCSHFTLSFERIREKRRKTKKKTEAKKNIEQQTNW